MLAHDTRLTRTSVCTSNAELNVQREKHVLLRTVGSQIPICVMRIRKLGF